MRIIKGKSPFSPDRNHIHHLLLDRGFNHKSVTYICAGATLIISAASFYLQFLGTSILIGILITGFFGWIYSLYLRRSRFKLRVIKGDMDKRVMQEEKRVRLVSVANHQVAAVIDED